MTFTSSEEADLIHVAGAGMAELLGAVPVCMNWIGGHLSPHKIDPPGPPRHRLELTVDPSMNGADSQHGEQACTKQTSEADGDRTDLCVQHHR
ncbi:hypothetical protein OHA74_14015 [Streptomyces phaeochromogenes]|uniref:hypothetical protein n=1 Tax=Streptomyces phaeochromogenes TaxID=1923 RepID=UPI002E2AF3F6|nr:hypothetical protein [Streptomyces phaeochromogenes]